MIKYLQFILIVVTVTSCAENTKNISYSADARKCIQKAFEYTAKDQSDSVRSLFSFDLFKNDNDYKFYFADIKKIINENGIPEFKDLQSFSIKPFDDIRDYVNYIPKPADSLYVDSVNFMFRKSGRYDKLVGIEVHNNAKLFDNIIIK